MKPLDPVHCRRSLAALAIVALLLPAALVAQMPPHPRLAEDVRSGFVKRPYALDKLSALRARGIDAPWRSQGLDAIQRQDAAPFARTLGPASPNAGTWRALVILVDFTDKTAKVAASSFDNLLFSTNSGSLRDYYRRVTYDALDIVTVHLPGSIGWTRAPQTYAYYVDGQNGFGTYPKNAQKLAEVAVAAANALVDYSQYDNDGDGYVDALFVVHAGSGAEYTGSDNDIWSHAWVTSSPLSVDGVYVYHYSMEPEYWASAGDMTIGVYAHELGHAAFGLPDLYDRDGSSEGLGEWSLMAGGSWNGTGVGGNFPAFPDAWSHWQMGYLPITNIPANTAAQPIRAVATTAEAFRLWTDGATGGAEYFLIENRQRTGYDAYLPEGGLLIYHVDENVVTQNDNEYYPGHVSGGHYQVSLEQADGNWQLERNLNRGDAGDPFPGSTAATEFTFGSTPDTRTYTGGNTNIRVRNISPSAATMTADLEVTFTGTALTLLSPNGGEQLEAGSTQTIQWEWLGTSGEVNIAYSTDDGSTWIPILASGASSPARRDLQLEMLPGEGARLARAAAPASTPGIIGSYTWLVPMMSSVSCRVRVTGVSTPSLTDQSNRTFAIVPPGGDLWSVQFNYDATDVTGDGGNAGAVFIPTMNEFWTSRWASNLLHRWTPEGTLKGSFTVSGVTGVRGMTFDGTSVIAATNSTTLYAINPATRTLTTTIPVPISARYVTFDPTANGGAGGYWIGGFTTSPVLVTRAGSTIRSIAYATLGSTSNYGAAFDTYSEGGPFLWFFGYGLGSGTPQRLVQVNPATGLPTGVTHDVLSDVGAGIADGLAGGIFIATGLVPNTATLGGLLQGSPNRLFGYFLAATSPTFGIRALLEGPYDPGTQLMKNTLRQTGALEAHFGSIPIPGGAIDTIAIELRNAQTAEGSSVREVIRAWLLADGTVRAFADTAIPYITPTVPGGDYYIVVTHRNHISAMSASTVHIGALPVVYDFTTGTGQYFGGQAKDLGNGMYGLYCGDTDRGGDVNALDRAATWNATGQSGYLPADVDLSGMVDESDRTLTWNNRNVATRVP